MPPHKEYDLIVIGAGWFGLAAAKTYLELHPLQSILVLDQDSSCGGTWSRNRVYPGLHSNNLRGGYEFPDFPMSEAVYGVREGEHIPGEVLHRYLTDFAAAHGILERTRLGVHVGTVEETETGWKVHVSPSLMPEKTQEVLRTKRLIIATGMTSQPNMPRFPGQETFTAPLFHVKELGQQSSVVQSCTRAVVVGAGKSAYDCAYALATGARYSRVELVVRPGGQGPVWLCPAYVTPLKRKLEALLHTRLLTWFSPCPWGSEDSSSRLPRRWLHGTAPGRLLTRAVWAALGSDVVRANGYRRHVELRKLQPWRSIFYTGSALGIHNYARNIHHLVRQGRIKVHISDVACLRGREVLLTDGTSLDGVDALVCATGWTKQCPIRFISADPAPSSYRDALSPETMQELAFEADDSILASFPMLRDSHTSKIGDGANQGGPLRNYRFIVPINATRLSRRTLAYAGMLSSVSTPIIATVQALWICAFFDGKLARAPPPEPVWGPAHDALAREVMLHTQFGRWRYPCGRYGAAVPDLALEALPYVDLLLNDLGVQPWRKGSWIRDLLEGYGPGDYAGLIQEWLVGRNLVMMQMRDKG
ncbi:hypothetical protein E4U30_001829 [Claviceps sp. LM220 group G6]|nr:hypothetical protein E4U30_001829 [Claviceps sp. LM220 group G6]